MQRLPNVRSGNTPGIDYGASSVYRDNVPDNLQVTSIGASQLGVSNLNVTGTFSYTNINASAIVETNQLKEFTSGAGIQLINSMTLVGSLTTLKFPVFDNSGSAITGYATLGSYDPFIANTMDFRNSSTGGFAFYNTNGLIASLTKNGANQGMLTTDSVFPVNAAVGVTINSAVIGDSTCVTAGSLRFHGGVLQYADISGTYNTISVGTAYTGGANINVAGGVISLNGNVNTNQVTAGTMLTNILSFANTTNGQINLATTNTYICNSAGLQSANLQVDGTAKMTITPSATGLWVGGSVLYPSYSLMSAVVIGASAPTVPGGMRFSGGALQYCDNTSTWQTLIGNTLAGTFTATTLVSNYSAATTYGLQVINSANATLENLASFLAPALPDGSKSRLLFGRSETTNNAAYIDYNFVVAGSASNSLGLGLVGFPNLVTVTQGTTTINNALSCASDLAVMGNTTVSQLLTVTGATALNGGASVSGSSTGSIISAVNNASGSTVLVFSGLTPNITSSQVSQIVFGKETTLGNCASMKFDYQGPNSPYNSFVFGIYGNNPSLTLTSSSVDLNAAVTVYNGLNMYNGLLQTKDVTSSGIVTINNVLNVITNPSTNPLVSFTTNGFQNVNTIANMLAPNLADTQRVEFNLGQATTSGNSGNIGYCRATVGGNYLNFGINGNRDIIKVFNSAVAISAATTITGNLTVTGTLQAAGVNISGTTSFTDISVSGLASLTNLGVTGTSTISGTTSLTMSSTDAPLQITNTLDAVRVLGLQVYAPNMATSRRTRQIFGVNSSNYNYGCMDFVYNGVGSTTNVLSFGVGTTVDALKIDGDGDVSVVNNLNVVRKVITPSFGPPSGENIINLAVDLPLAANTDGSRLNLHSYNSVAPLSNVPISTISFYGTNGAYPSTGLCATISVNSAQAWTTNARGSYMDFYTTANNTNVVQKVLSLGQDKSTTALGVVNCSVGLISNSAVSTTASGQFINTAVATVIPNITSFAPNMTASQKISFRQGLSATNFNCATISFVYNNAGSTANTLNLGFLGAENLFILDGTGTFTFNGTGNINGNFNVASGVYANAVVRGTNLTSTTAALLGLDNTNTVGTHILQQCFSANLPTGQKTETMFGVANTANNCVIFDFNYVGSGSTSNYLGIGFNGSSNLATFTAAGVFSVPRLSVTTADNTAITATNTSTGNPVLNAVNLSTSSCTTIWSLASSMTTGNSLSMYHGVSGTGSYNASILQFNYNGVGSSSNTYGIGFFGANNRWTVDGLGNTIQTGLARMTSIKATANNFYIRPNTDGVFDFFISADAADTTAYEITPFQGGAVYLKAKIAGTSINHQFWLAGTPTNALTFDNNGLFADYLMIGTNKRSNSGAIAMGGGMLQYMDGTNWGYVPMSYTCSVTVSNSGGTINTGVVGIGPGTYSVALDGSLAYQLNLNFPGTFTGRTNISACSVTFLSTNVTTPPIISPLAEAPTGTIRIRLYNTTGGVTNWITLLPVSGNQIVFTLNVHG